METLNFSHTDLFTVEIAIIFLIKSYKYSIIVIFKYTVSYDITTLSEVTQVPVFE